jgi:hypothetical protein
VTSDQVREEGPANEAENGVAGARDHSKRIT